MNKDGHKEKLVLNKDRQIRKSPVNDDGNLLWTKMEIGGNLCSLTNEKPALGK